MGGTLCVSTLMKSRDFCKSVTEGYNVFVLADAAQMAHGVRRN